MACFIWLPCKSVDQISRESPGEKKWCKNVTYKKGTHVKCTLPSVSFQLTEDVTLFLSILAEVFKNPVFVFVYSFLC